MKLTAQERAQAQDKLKNISAELIIDEEIKNKIKNISKTITELIDKTQGKEQLNLLSTINNGVVTKLTVELQARNRWFNSVEERMKAEREKINKQKIRAFEEKERAQYAIEQIKQTIQKIRTTVKESVEQEEKKRKKIQEDLEKSLDQIREKIALFTKESQEIEAENVGLRQKVAEIKSKMEGLETDFKAKAQQKDNEVKAEKQELIEKLRVLEQQVNKVTQLNKQFSASQKKNFDQKLNIHLRTQKFPQYCGSFENSANTIGQCKDQLIKGVNRLNDANEKIAACDKKNKDLAQEYLKQLKKKNEKDEAIESIKAQKQIVRNRILQLQNKIKEKNLNKV